MKTFTLTAASVLAMSATSSFADGHAGTMGYALANDGMTLVTMASIAAPADIATFDLSNKLDAIAYRPVTGDLLGYSNGTIYAVNAATGELSDLGATFMEDAMVMDGAVATAMDFNNAIDAVRMVGSDGTNLVYFPEGFGDMDERAGSVRKFTSTFYVDGDNSTGKTPEIFANAYTNAIAGMKAESTFQYALDSQANALVSLANNAGELTTVGLITVDGEAADVIPMGGFDIVSSQEGSDAAYAILQMDGADTAGLYAIDLDTGAATLLSDLGMGGFTGFAVSQGV